jgi:hypothetical protein
VEFLARVGSVASITFLLVLFAGEGLHPSQVTARQWVGLLFFPVGVIIGMVIAWWKEALGAAITLASLLALYVVYGFFMRYHVSGWAFVVFASPAFLFLLHWLFSAPEQRRAFG